MPDADPRRRADVARSAGKLWSGRFSSATSAQVERYTEALDTDARLLADDIAGSIAHVTMLHEIGVLSVEEHRSLIDALQRIDAEVRRGDFRFHPGDEDIHTAVERRVAELTDTAVAGKLHSGRSRNDQVATDLRLYCKRTALHLVLAVTALQESLLHRAGETVDAVMPGYTHLQRAQPVSLAHHLLAYVEMLQRDVERIAAARQRCDELPLGSGALAGSTLPLDRGSVARRLGFTRVSANSLDAVSDRDFVVELAAACALVMVHCSRLCEELVLWSSTEFGFVELPDSHATGSSLMPQKKNPDLAELGRARSGRVIGALVALLTMLKGLPLAYNRDLQEDKRALFDALDTTGATLEMLADLVGAADFRLPAMRAAAGDPALLATDVAEHLVQRGVPFRQAHRAVGEMVRRAQAEGRTLADVSAAEWQAAAPGFAADPDRLFDVEAALRRRDLTGGPGPGSVARQLERAAALIAGNRRLVDTADAPPSTQR